LGDLKESYEKVSGETLSYRAIAHGSRISNSTVSKILNGQSQIADFEVTSKLLGYFSDLMGRQVGLTEILHHEPDVMRNEVASEKQALIN